MIEAERDKLALEVELLKLKASFKGKVETCDEDSEERPTSKSRRKKIIDWPQEFTPGTSQVEYEKLDMSDFVAGFLAMIKPYEAQRKSDMLNILELLMIKASSYLWRSVRSFYAYIARQVELSRLDFHDIGAIREAASIFFKHSDLRVNSLRHIPNFPSLILDILNSGLKLRLIDQGF